MSIQTAQYTSAHELPTRPAPTGKRLGVLTLTALGVVYGDIGTSPLYALRECFKHEYGILPTPENIVGVLSLILWSLILVVSVKYLVFILRADNRGEGGILSLLALLLQQKRRADDQSKRFALIALGLFGAALLCGEGIITPAVSVLSAVEGLEVGSPALARFVVPITVLILFGLFMVQRFGTTRVGTAFGPIMLVWFVTIATLGIRGILDNPGVLAAINPVNGIRFFGMHGTAGFLTLGAVVLCITGCEALYADMGHFGKRPIRIAWFAVALPSLMLNYFGQGALLLGDPAAASNPFYLLAPPSFQWPLLAIATAAAIVASQALISGAYSLTQQSIQLGYSPRMQIVHTSENQAGQIYIPEINNALMIGCLILVVAFKSSTALTAAYGIAVTGAMAITSVLFGVVARTRWEWPLNNVLFLVGAFLLVDLSFLAANVVKVKDGGWVPLAIAIAIYTLMSTWKRGRMQLGAIQEQNALPLETFLSSISRNPPLRVRGTAVFMTSTPEGAPVVMLHHLKHNKMLHETVILLSVQTRGVPHVNENDNVSIETLGEGFHRVIATFGFMDSPNIPEVLARASKQGIPVPPMDTSYYLGRERLVLTGVAKMSRPRKKLFALMSRNARSATEFFQIPPNRVVELGAQIEF
jgi:KUP system potassium uptake protein